MKPKIEGMIVFKDFKLVKELGSGAFGKIYLAIHQSNSNQHYAVKLEDSKTKSPQLFYESKLYRYLNTDNKDHGIPRVYNTVTEGAYNIMIMDLLGSSLEDLFQQYNKKFSLRCVLQITDQLLQRIEYLHTKQFIHRDLKPDNFLIGKGKNSWKIYLIDFGLSKKYIREGAHIPYKEGKDLTGTARYASINTHIGIEQARRDDLQSIGYILLYFLRGILPWQNMKAKDTETKYRLIKQKKQSTPHQQLCKGFPEQFITYLECTKSLKFEEAPDYAFLRNLFQKARNREKVELDWNFDWTNIQPQKGVQQNPTKNTEQQGLNKKLGPDNATQKKPVPKRGD